MSREAILAAIPHRPPMLLVDVIVEQTADSIVCEKTFHPDEFFVQGHYPDQPIVPGVILCESAMQAGAVLLAGLVQEGDGVPVATRLQDVKFKKIVQPGDTIRLEVKLNEQLANAFFMSAKVMLDGKLSARLEFACTLAAREG
ncbi:MAG TPA: beta-hydroxyacyl-ACP dehydratase [Planctomycetaceae bacterium]|nr:beta-hydroxyacyl-ACP dehydratase [Planctomycetaceae bacterium]